MRAYGMPEELLKRPPLFDWHVARGAKMVAFGGWEMPVQYSGIVGEHRGVRTSAGVFDVSHMGEFEFSGSGGLDLLERLVVSDIKELEVGSVQYSMFLNSSGGTVDDTMLYRLDSETVLAVVNASNISKDWDHVTSVAKDFPEARVENVSSDYALLALQGPKAAAILGRVVDSDPAGLPFHRTSRMKINGIPVLVATSGYTGENGFDVSASPERAAEVIELILEVGSGDGILPAGLGARDTLRLEASLALYGHELDESTSPLEARLDFCVSDRTDYIGADVLQRMKEQGLSKRLVMLEMVESGIPREGYAILNKIGDPVGRVTSGSFAPWLKKSIAMAFVPAKLTRIGREYWVDIRGRARKAVVVKRPFYRRPSR